MRSFWLVVLEVACVLVYFMCVCVCVNEYQISTKLRLLSYFLSLYVSLFLFLGLDLVNRIEFKFDHKRCDEFQV